MGKVIRPFVVGDYVTVAPEIPEDDDDFVFPSPEGECLVIKVDRTQGTYEYGLSPGGWWFDHDRLTLSREATEESVSRADSIIEGDDGAEGE